MSYHEEPKKIVNTDGEISDPEIIVREHFNNVRYQNQKLRENKAKSERRMLEMMRLYKREKMIGNIPYFVYLGGFGNGEVASSLLPLVNKDLDNNHLLATYLLISKIGFHTLYFDGLSSADVNKLTSLNIKYIPSLVDINSTAEAAFYYANLLKRRTTPFFKRGMVRPEFTGIFDEESLRLHFSEQPDYQRLVKLLNNECKDLRPIEFNQGLEFIPRLNEQIESIRHSLDNKYTQILEGERLKPKKRFRI